MINFFFFILGASARPRPSATGKDGVGKDGVKNGVAELTAFLALILASSIACYRPSIANGRLGCAAADKCPAGFTCRESHCWADGTGPDIAPDAADPTDQNPAMPDGPAESSPCAAPRLAGCTPQIIAGAACDPVCQTGTCNWCNQKCTIVGDGTPACAAYGQASTGMSCTISNLATTSQRDNCAINDICLNPDLGDLHSYCFTRCRTSAECPGGVACGDRVVAPSSSSVGLPPLVKVCDPPYQKCDVDLPGNCCDPIAGSGCGVGRFCYLVSPDVGTGDSRTVCEFASGGSVRVSCRSSRDCMPGYGCTPSNSGFCQRVCNDTNPCANGTCDHLNGGAQYGYCPL